jgi:LVIVD repeat-containing protein
VLPSGAIGIRLSPGGDTMYVTDATGLGIYDVTRPDSPQIRSHVPLPRLHAAGELHLVDVSDPAAPAIVETRQAPGDLTIYDVRDLSQPAAPPPASDEQLAWVADEDGTFAFDITETRPRLVLGGPGDPRPGHWLLLGALTAPARGRGWPHRGAPVGFYVSTERFWGAYLAPADCPPLGSRGRDAERMTLSPIGESGRPASWGRRPVPSPF